jgi:hypothetical protein
MALSPAEKQKRYRERKKQADKAAVDAVSTYLKRPFSEWLSKNDGNFNDDFIFPLDWAGIKPPRLLEGRGPRVR